MARIIRVVVDEEVTSPDNKSGPDMLGVMRALAIDVELAAMIVELRQLWEVQNENRAAVARIWSDCREADRARNEAESALLEKGAGDGRLDVWQKAVLRDRVCREQTMKLSEAKDDACQRIIELNGKITKHVHKYTGAPSGE